MSRQQLLKWLTNVSLTVMLLEQQLKLMKNQKWIQHILKFILAPEKQQSNNKIQLITKAFKNKRASRVFRLLKKLKLKTNMMKPQLSKITKKKRLNKKNKKFKRLHMKSFKYKLNKKKSKSKNHMKKKKIRQ